MNVGMHGTGAKVDATGDTLRKYVELVCGEERDA